MSEAAEYENIQFRTDHSGNDVAVRPNQLLVSVLKDRTLFRDALAEALAVTIGPNRLEGEAATFLEQVLEITGLGPRDTPEIAEEWNQVRDGFLDAVVPGDTELIEDRGVPVGVTDRLFTIEGPGDFQVDVVRLVRELERRGLPAQPNHVYFVTSVAGHSFTPGNGKFFNPNLIAANNFNPNLIAGNNFNPNLIAGNNFNPNLIAALAGGCGGCCSGRLANTGTRGVPKLGAEPAEPLVNKSGTVAGEPVEIHIIDVATPDPNLDTDFVTGELEKQPLKDGVDENEDGAIDPATGHGDFVKSIVQLHSGLGATLWHAASPLGAIDDACLVDALQTVDARVDDPENDTRKILNLSLGGYNIDDRPSLILATQIERMIDTGWLIVASAGNNASCRLTWPAALPGVVAVGAVGPCGPAWFSNFGPWVDVSAAGVDVVAQYPDLSGKAGVVDLDSSDSLSTGDFNTGWATWSGTSFSAPLVTARLATELQKPAPSRKAAIEGALDEVVRNPDLCHIPNYGSIVTEGALWPSF